MGVTASLTRLTGCLQRSKGEKELADFRTGNTSGFLMPATTRHQAMRKRCLAWFRTGTLLGLCIMCAHAAAQVLDTIEASRQGDSAVTEANFSRPVFYVRHFPPEKGDTLQIYLRVPVVVSEQGCRCFRSFGQESGGIFDLTNLTNGP